MSTFWVAKTGNDANPGTEALPKLTIGAGLGLLATSDTLIIKAGTYVEAINNPVAGVSGSPTIIRANTGDTVTVGPQSLGVDQCLLLDTNHDFVRFDGLVVDATVQSAFGVFTDNTINGAEFLNVEVKNARHSGFLVSGDSLLFAACHVHNNGTDVSLDHGFYFQASNSTVRGCNVHDNTGWGIQDFSGLESATNNTITGNKFHHQTQGGAGGMTIVNGSGHLITNNIVYTCNIGADIHTATTKFFNNTVYGCTNEGIVAQASADSTTEIRNNISFNNNPNLSNLSGATVGTLFTADPQFVNAAAENFHLQSTSGAIDAGDTLSQVTTDFDGLSRPQGQAYDDGGFEFSSGGVPFGGRGTVAWILASR